MMPNPLWVSQCTYVSTEQGFVIDTFANKIVGWRASKSQQTQFVLDALKHALYEPRPADSLVHRNDQGCQYLSIKYKKGRRRPGWNPALVGLAVRMTGPRHDHDWPLQGRRHSQVGTVHVSQSRGDTCCQLMSWAQRAVGKRTEYLNVRQSTTRSICLH
jgi:hypothetical protein